MVTNDVERQRKVYIDLTPERKQTILDLIAHGYNVTSASRKVGINPGTAWLHMSNDPAFKEAIELARIQGIESVEDINRQLAMTPDPKTFLDRIAWLKAHNRAKWGDQTQITQNTNVRIQFVPAPTAAQLIEADMRILQDSVPDGADALRITAGGDDSSEAYDADSLP